MALKKCEECGKQISDKAEACPNCGAPTIPNLANTKVGIDKIAGILFVLWIVYVIVAPDSPKRLNKQQQLSADKAEFAQMLNENEAFKTQVSACGFIDTVNNMRSKCVRAVYEKYKKH